MGIEYQKYEMDNSAINLEIVSGIKSSVKRERLTIIAAFQMNTHNINATHKINTNGNALEKSLGLLNAQTTIVPAVAKDIGIVNAMNIGVQKYFG